MALQRFYPASPWLRLLIAVDVSVLVAIIVFVAGARSGWWTPDDQSLRARYALPESEFVDIDGQSIHVVDEGQGPLILLVHGSFGSLRMWESWAERLRAKYRVIRFDRPPMGLSGASPTGDYGTEREMRVIGALADRAGAERFVLVGTSSAGVSVAGYAAAHPGRVQGLVLSNIAAGRFATDRSHLGAWFKAVLWVDSHLGGWHPQALWREVLRNNFHDPARVTESLVEEWTDLNNRAQRMPRAAGGESPVAALDRTPRDLPLIQAPTLVLWSDHDHELPRETVGRKVLDLLGSPDKSLAVVERCGHMMPLECGDRAIDQALPFLERIAP
jgi:pimeloyl-ACP methyl ester carboxylesterase